VCEPVATADAAGYQLEVAAGVDCPAPVVATARADAADEHSEMRPPQSPCVGAAEVARCATPPPVLSSDAALLPHIVARPEPSGCADGTGAAPQGAAFGRSDVLGLPAAPQALLRGRPELLPPSLQCAVFLRLSEPVRPGVVGLLRLWIQRAAVMVIAFLIAPLALLLSALLFLRDLWTVDRVVTVHFALLCLLLVAIAITDAAMATG